MRKSGLIRIAWLLAGLMLAGAGSPRRAGAQNDNDTNGGGAGGDGGRMVQVAGEVLALPEGVPLPEALRQTGPLTYAAVEAMENLANSRVQILARPEVRIGNGDLGRFTLREHEGGAPGERPLPFLRLEVIPAVRDGGRVALNVRIETEDASGVVDRMAGTRVFRANSGDYEIFGPLQLEGRRIFVLLRVGLS